MTEDKGPTPNDQPMETRTFNLGQTLKASDAMARALHDAYVAHSDLLQVLADVSGRPMHQFHPTLPILQPKGNRYAGV